METDVPQISTINPVGLHEKLFRIRGIGFNMGSKFAVKKVDFIYFPLCKK
jgi:hypothetical protein